jgi:hypothetical protein
VTGDGSGDADGSGARGTDADEPDGGRLAPDPERVRLLREVAEDVRGESRESERIAAVLYRVSDCFDPAESTTPEDVYLNVRTILRVTERGTLARDRDGDRDGTDRGDGSGE